MATTFQTQTSSRRPVVHPGPRPRRLTVAAVLALVSAGITTVVALVLLSMDPNTAGIDPDALAAVRPFAYLGLGFATLYAIGAIAALQGRGTTVLSTAAGLVIATNVVSLLIAPANFNPLGLILPIVILNLVRSDEVVIWTRACRSAGTK